MVYVSKLLLSEHVMSEDCSYQDSEGRGEDTQYLLLNREKEGKNRSDTKKICLGKLGCEL